MRIGSLRLPLLLVLTASGGCFNPTPSGLDTDTSVATSSTMMGSSSDGVVPATDDDASTSVADSSGGSTCDDPLIDCGGTCVDPQTDIDHCGGCDSSCAADQLCEAGACTSACDEPLVPCSGACVDLQTDSSHCGGCQSPCDSGEQCEAGGCIPDCEAGLVPCADTCVDVSSDDAHCGACDVPCDPGEHCVAQTCQPACPLGMVECDGACLDPQSDPMHCGAGLDCAAQPGASCMGMEICSGGMCELVACAGFSAAVFDPTTMFAQINTDNTIAGIAWDGMSYWAVSGGSSGGTTEAQYNAAGVSLATFMAGIDFRSIFTQGDGTAGVYARGFGDATVLVQNAPGAFVNSITLVGGSLDSQAMVVWDDVASEFIAVQDGTLSRWDPTGSFLGTLDLLGYGANAGELDFPQNRNLAWAQGCYLTYNSGELSAWDPLGNRVDTATLNGGGGGLPSNLSLSYANGQAWVSDDADWRGYDVF